MQFSTAKLFSNSRSRRSISKQKSCRILYFVTPHFGTSEWGQWNHLMGRSYKALLCSFKYNFVSVYCIEARWNCLSKENIHSYWACAVRVRVKGQFFIIKYKRPKPRAQERRTREPHLNELWPYGVSTDKYLTVFVEVRWARPSAALCEDACIFHFWDN